MLRKLISFINNLKGLRIFLWFIVKIYVYDDPDSNDISEKNINNNDKIGHALMLTITLRVFIYYSIIDYFIKDPATSSEVLRTVLIIDRSIVECFFNNLDEEDRKAQAALVEELLNEKEDLKEQLEALNAAEDEKTDVADDSKIEKKRG